LITKKSSDVPLSEIMKNDYKSAQERIYDWGYPAVRFMFESHRNELEAMLASLGKTSTAIRRIQKTHGYDP